MISASFQSLYSTTVLWVTAAVSDAQGMQLQDLPKSEWKVCQSATWQSLGFYTSENKVICQAMICDQLPI